MNCVLVHVNAQSHSECIRAAVIIASLPKVQRNIAHIASHCITCTGFITMWNSKKPWRANGKNILGYSSNVNTLKTARYLFLCK